MHRVTSRPSYLRGYTHVPFRTPHFRFTSSTAKINHVINTYLPPDIRNTQVISFSLANRNCFVIAEKNHHHKPYVQLRQKIVDGTFEKDWSCFLEGLTELTKPTLFGYNSLIFPLEDSSTAIFHYTLGYIAFLGNITLWMADKREYFILNLKTDPLTQEVWNKIKSQLMYPEDITIIESIPKDLKSIFSMTRHLKSYHDNLYWVILFKTMILEHMKSKPYPKEIRTAILDLLSNPYDEKIHIRFKMMVNVLWRSEIMASIFKRNVSLTSSNLPIAIVMGDDHKTPFLKSLLK